MFISMLAPVMANRKITTNILCDKIGCSANVITRIKEGKVEPSLEMAIRIAKVLDCNVIDIFNYD